MAKWKQLIAAREYRHLSQFEAAEQVNIGHGTYQRWESGKARPQPQHMRQLCEVFGTLLENPDAACSRDVPAPETTSASSLTTSVMRDLSVEEIDELQAFITAHITTRLLSLAFMEHPTHDDKRDAIRQAIEEFDTMNTHNKNYQITRREALYSLATLPLITCGLTIPGKAVQPAQYGTILAQCTASLEACWQLSNGSDASGLTLAFKCVSQYLPILETIARNASQHRKEALDLAARYALLKTALSWHCAGLTETLQYAKDAVALGKETGDMLLQLSSYSKLAWTYLYVKKYGAALATAQEAQVLLEQSTTPLPPGIRGGIYSTLALTQANNGKQPDAAVGKATEVDPGIECYAFMEFTRSTLPMEVGLIYCHQGNQTKAMETLETIIDPTTLIPKIPLSWGVRQSVIHTMTLSSLKAKDRDMEKTVQFWIATVEGAKALQSEWAFNKALMAYELMEVVWPGEQRIMDLRDHIDHW